MRCSPPPFLQVLLPVVGGLVGSFGLCVLLALLLLKFVASASFIFVSSSRSLGQSAPAGSWPTIFVLSALRVSSYRHFIIS